MVFLQIIIPLTGFVLLWLFPNTIAQLVVKPSNNESIKPMNPIDWLRIIIISMGLYITIYALFDVIYWVSAYQMMIRDDAMMFMSEQKAAIITTGVEFIIGIVSVSKNFWIAQTLHKINAPEVTPQSNQDD